MQKKTLAVEPSVLVVGCKGPGAQEQGVFYGQRGGGIERKDFKA